MGMDEGSCRDLYRDMMVHTERSPLVKRQDEIPVAMGDIPYMVSEEGSWSWFVKASSSEKAYEDAEWLLLRCRLANGSPEGPMRESRCRP